MLPWFQFNYSAIDIDSIVKLRVKYGNIPIHATKFNGGALWVDKNIAVFVMEGLSNSVRLWSSKNIPNNSYFFFTNQMFPYSLQEIKNQIDFFHEVTSGRFDNTRLIHMANDTQSLEHCIKLGLVNSFFCNQNCWIDFDIFKITRDVKYKRFDFVINLRPELIKRPFLAQKVKKLCVIQGALYRQDEYFDLQSLNPDYINKSRITQVEVNDLLNQSYAGGIFSEKEGACFASSEYLLAGIPVVSTKSTGGRDYWYNENNSIIVEPTPEAVFEGVRIAKEKLIIGDFSSVEIRNQHVKESIRLRKKFIEKLGYLFALHGILHDPEVIVHAYCNHGSFFKSKPYPNYRLNADIN
ncbi:MAG: hypothetical protein LBF12_01610 [Christensenellaceae bacterium]|jgi:hypothetical protein|nr:hypothetical protein [Christensenellaceae bacterium]